MTRIYIPENHNSEFTSEELEMLKAADEKEPVFDEDCPAMTKEQYEYYSKLLAEKRSQKRTRVVSIRLSESTINKARQLGSGYTGVLSRIIEYGLNNADVLAHCV